MCSHRRDRSPEYDLVCVAINRGDVARPCPRSRPRSRNPAVPIQHRRRQPGRGPASRRAIPGATISTHPVRASRTTTESVNRLLPGRYPMSISGQGFPTGTNNSPVVTSSEKAPHTPPPPVFADSGRSMFRRQFPCPWRSRRIAELLARGGVVGHHPPRLPVRYLRCPCRRRPARPGEPPMPLRRAEDHR